jgi:hypothetical protein
MTRHSLGAIASPRSPWVSAAGNPRCTDQTSRRDGRSGPYLYGAVPPARLGRNGGCRSNGPAGTDKGVWQMVEIAPEGAGGTAEAPVHAFAALAVGALAADAEARRHSEQYRGLGQPISPSRILHGVSRVVFRPGKSFQREGSSVLRVFAQFCAIIAMSNANIAPPESLCQLKSTPRLFPIRTCDELGLQPFAIGCKFCSCDWTIPSSST